MLGKNVAKMERKKITTKTQRRKTICILDGERNNLLSPYSNQIYGLENIRNDIFNVQYSRTAFFIPIFYCTMYTLLDLKSIYFIPYKQTNLRKIQNMASKKYAQMDGKLHGFLVIPANMIARANMDNSN